MEDMGDNQEKFWKKNKKDKRNAVVKPFSLLRI